MPFLAVLLGTSFVSGLAAGARAAGEDDFRYLISMKTRAFIPAAQDYSAGLDFLTLHRSESAVHMLVQMIEVPAAAVRVAMADHGLLLQGYLPERTYYAQVSTALRAPDLATMGVRWLAPLQREEKVAPRLLSGEYGPWTIYENNWRIYALQFHDDATRTQAEDLLRSIPKQEGGWIQSTRTLIAAMDPVHVEEVARLDAVKYVDQIPPNLSQVNDQVRSALSVDQLFSPPYGLSGAGSMVMEYDAGLADPNHPDFASGRITWGENGNIIQHSTHVAGTVVGNGASSNGRFAGMAPGARLVSYAYESCGPYCLYNSPQDLEANYTDGLQDHHADLATNSLGSNIAANGYPCNWEGDYEQVAQLLDAISAGSLGIPFLSCWAAGNERAYGTCGTSYNTTGVPATAKNIITVGATNSNDHSMTYFSSWGPVDDGRIRPDVCAPGCQTGGDGGVTSTIPGSGYGVLCGTSMATPATAGCIADIMQQWRMRFGFLRRPAPSTIKGLLIQTAHDYGNAGPDFQFGFGEIRPVDAVDHIRNAYLLKEGSLDTGGEDTYDIVVPAGQAVLQATCVWDDPPGQYLAQKELVNDLDLTLVSPSGQVALPWVLNPSSPGTAATRGEDRLNPVEQVVVNDPQAGTWTVHVRGYQVPQGPQPYSVLANVSLVPTAVGSQAPAVHAGLGDLSSYPNPFSPMTTITFSHDGTSPVSLLIYDASGRLVRTLLSQERRAPGVQFVPWDGRDDDGHSRSSGAYFYQVVTRGQSAGRKLLMVR